ncbi:unnamed protein product [Orchesella dallaii]|uniref:UDP-D-xylose:beta-D-glucoside alpha-1,3-D-xylosyltransferase n=1 Tax=Orchesella dallaii TaxID=48710 RepID=A0ABP1RGV8_9HEXA
MWNILALFNLRNSLKIILLLVTTIALVKYIKFNSSQKSISSIFFNNRRSSNPKFDAVSVPKKSPIQIGIVACAGPRNANLATLESLTLIKSIIISATIYNNMKELHFHIFVDSAELEKYLEDVIMFDFILKARKNIQVQTYFYNVLTVLPAGSGKEFWATELPCTYVRLFFPEVLSTLDEILYLDTDIIITGNIGKIWERLKGIDEQKLVALVPNNELEDKNFHSIDLETFGELPHVPPKGVNAGVFYMKLESLRKIGWTSQLLELYRKYKDTVKINDQKLINLFLHYHPEMLEVLPCNYNFQHLHCSKGLTCKEAIKDQTGVQILHGTGSTFYEVDQAHHLIFEAYKKFDLGAPEGIFDGLLNPLKKYYTEVKNESTCDGALGPLLFKDVIER